MKRDQRVAEGVVMAPLSKMFLSCEYINYFPASRSELNLWFVSRKDWESHATPGYQSSSFEWKIFHDCMITEHFYLMSSSLTYFVDSYYLNHQSHWVSFKWPSSVCLVTIDCSLSQHQMVSNGHWLSWSPTDIQLSLEGHLKVALTQTTLNGHSTISWIHGALENLSFVKEKA